MGEELEPREEIHDAEVVIPDEQKATAVWRHPQRDVIHALLRRGKSTEWIAYWLADQYPTIDEDPQIDAADSQQNMRWRIRAEKLEEYRARWMPECEPGIDVIDPELEDLVGRRMPSGMQGPRFELEVIETGISVAQMNLARSLKADDDLKMLTQTTMEATDRLIAAARTSVEVKSKLGEPGYEPLPEHKIIDQTNRNTNLSVDLHGKLDPRTGKLGPSDPGAVEVVKQLMAGGPEGVKALIDQAKQIAEASAPTPNESNELQTLGDGDDEPSFD